MFAKVARRQISALRARAKKICSRCKSADEMRVFVACRCAQLCCERARRAPPMRAFAGAMTAHTGGFTKPKKFCGDGLWKACWRPFEGAKRANRADRFAPALPPEARCSAAAWPRVGEFRRRFDRRGVLAGGFSADIAATSVALRRRCASSADR
jgi:hypothetical protein